MPVALKVFPVSAREADNASILREVQLQQRLRDPRIASIYGVARTDAEIWVVMELLETSLHSALHRDAAPLSLVQRLQIAYQVASVLARLHSGKLSEWVPSSDSASGMTRTEVAIVHADLKPQVRQRTQSWHM